MVPAFTVNPAIVLPCCALHPFDPVICCGPPVRVSVPGLSEVIRRAVFSAEPCLEGRDVFGPKVRIGIVVIAIRIVRGCSASKSHSRNLLAQEFALISAHLRMLADLRSGEVRRYPDYRCKRGVIGS
jgi:hypothetical protein